MRGQVAGEIQKMKNSFVWVVIIGIERFLKMKELKIKEEKINKKKTKK